MEQLRSALSTPYIEPAPPGDPQPNPPDHANAIYIQSKLHTPEEEINAVFKSLKTWLSANHEKTTAVLCPTNLFAKEVIEKLQLEGIEVVEMLQSSDRTRKVTRLIEKCLMSVSEPANIAKFCIAFDLFSRFMDENKLDDVLLSEFIGKLRKIKALESLVYPKEDQADAIQIDPGLSKLFKLDTFLKFIRRWHASSVLPIDQFILIIGSDLFDQPQDLALTHKLSLTLDFTARNHPEYRLPHFISELSQISGNERKFQGFSDDDTSFNPEVHKGKVLVTTYHKAKGLEWDRVYLMSVNNYDFPSLQEEDQYKGEKWFIRGNINLEAELISTLKTICQNRLEPAPNSQISATVDARIDYCAERLRLLYVGITRARESLIITWNTGKRKNCTMALPLQALSQYLEGKTNAAA